MANHNPPTNGLDKRKAAINRKGRPKSFDELRALAQLIAHERTNVTAQDGHALTVAEAILRQWAQSKNPQLQQRFIEVAFGKVPDKLDVTTNGEKLGPLVEVKPIDYRSIIAPLAPGSMADSEASGEDQSPLDGPALG